MKTILRSILIHVVLLLGFSVSLSAQAGSVLTLDEGSFRLEQTNALGGVNIDPIGKDRSNRACFRLKLHLDRMTPEDIRQVEVNVLGGNVVLMKRTVASGGNGLILEMTARPDTRFYIKHPSLGESNTVTISPEADKVYLMAGWADQKLTVVVSCAKAGADVWLDGVYRGKTGENMALNIQDVMAGSHTVKVQSGEDSAEKQIEVSPANVLFNIELKSAAHLQQLVVFKVSPSDALVEFDGEMLMLRNGITQKLVRFGTYSYSVKARNYHPERGVVTLDDMKAKKVLDVNLKPAFGWIEIAGEDAEGGTVYIDDQMIGTAPLKSGILASGNHTVKIVKPLYKGYETEIAVADNDITRIEPHLLPDFSVVTLQTEIDADIYVNGELMGNGSWTGNLQSGSYIVECRKSSHRSTVNTIIVSSDVPSQIISLTPPSPIYGTLYIQSEPNEAEVYMDGTHIGQTPLYLPEILVGNHTVKLTKSGCADWSGSVTVSEGHVAELNAGLPTGIPVTFTSNIPEAQVYLDGQLIGNVNKTYDIGYGSHDVVCKAEGKRDLTRLFSIAKDMRKVSLECRFWLPKETFKVLGISFNMIWVDGGSVIMGTTNPREVTLSGYYIGETEVTQALWQAVMGTNPSRWQGNNQPVAGLNWYDCQKFVNKLNSITDYIFRLPTEAEWVFAAKGGNESKGYKYSGCNNANNVAWTRDNSGIGHYSKTQTHRVGTKHPNELGIYDMSGNVWEWCDWDGKYLTSPSLMGGSCHQDPVYSIPNYYGSSKPQVESHDRGLRLVFVPKLSGGVIKVNDIEFE